MRNAGGALVAVLLAGAPAYAQDPLPSILVRRAPGASGCPETSEVAQSVDQLVGRRALATTQDPGAPARIEIEFLRTERGHAARVLTLRANRSRSVRDLHDDTPDSCAGLAEALTLTLALILDTMEGPPPVAAREVAAPAPASRKESWTGAVGAGTAITSGLLDSTRGALQASLDLASPGGHSVGAGFLWAPTEEIGYAPGSVSLSLWSGSLRGCVAVLGTARSEHLLVCAVPYAGQVTGAGSGFTTDKSASRPWFALGGEVAAQGPIARPLGWLLRAGVLFPLRQESFSIDRVGVAHTPSKQAVYLAAGLNWSIF